MRKPGALVGKTGRSGGGQPEPAKFSASQVCCLWSLIATELGSTDDISPRSLVRQGVTGMSPTELG